MVEKLSCDGDNIVTALFDVSLAGDLPDGQKLHNTVK